GILFGVFPDNERMGATLADLALEYSNAEKPVASSGVIPLTDLSAALNERTAQHMGLETGGEIRKQFDLIFPAP
ncbi:MAG: hypothetical protein ACREUA_09085, partial [Burkholderiales bacterium]